MAAIFGLIFTVLFYIIGFYLLFNCLYLLFFALAGHFLKKTVRNEAAINRSICILIPAYKENFVILESSARAVEHQYKGVFKVVVIADGLNEETVKEMTGFGAEVIPVNFAKSTKGKSLLYAMDNITPGLYDIALVLDIDNIMADDYLNEVNEAFDKGAKIVQTHRTAKNLDTSFAFLDACNEEINNHIYRKGHFAVGLSPALIGSGMAFDFNYLHSLLKNIGETVGEDKEMDFMIARNKTDIIYLNETLVYDEKIENAAVFTQQRTRWIAAQIEFVKKYFVQGFIELGKNGNFEFFNKMLQSILVPRMLLLGLLFVLSLAAVLFLTGFKMYFVLSLFCALCIALLLSLPAKYYKDKRLSSAVLRIPYAVISMVLALLRIKRAKTSFMPTPHAASSTSNDTHKKL